jgi:hypothetical protein
MIENTMGVTALARSFSGSWTKADGLVFRVRLISRPTISSIAAEIE